MKLLKWKKLAQGSTIEIVAPASAVKEEVLERGIQFLTQRGFKVHVSEGTLSPYLFHASPDQERFELLKSALNSEADAIWAIRGGYGSNRLMPMLAKLKKPKKQKIFIGISDVTSLHLFLNQKWGWPTLHASLLDRISEGKLPAAEVEETFSILMGHEKEVLFPGLRPLNSKAEKAKKISGPLIGGNLMTIQSTIGTSQEIQTQGKVLFLEEIDERGYRVDRMLTHLLQAGKVQGLKAIVFGHFIGGAEPGGQPAIVWEAIRRFALENPNIPIWSGVESGHDVKIRPLPLGTRVQILGNSLLVPTGVK